MNHGLHPALSTDDHRDEFLGGAPIVDSRFLQLTCAGIGALARGDVAHFHQLRRQHPDWNPVIYSNQIDYYRAEEEGFLDLKGIDLRNVDLRGTKFDRVSFADADFRGAKLTGTEFERCVLDRADFCNDHLQYAEFHWSSLRDANFQGVAANTTSFYDSDLTGASFFGADLRYVMRFWSLTLHDVNFRGTKFRPDVLSSNRVENIGIFEYQRQAFDQAVVHARLRELREKERELVRGISRR